MVEVVTLNLNKNHLQTMVEKWKPNTWLPTLLCASALNHYSVQLFDFERVPELFLIP